MENGYEVATNIQQNMTWYGLKLGEYICSKGWQYKWMRMVWFTGWTNKIGKIDMESLQTKAGQTNSK